MLIPARDANARGRRLVLALGDPAGIGAEVVLKAVAAAGPTRVSPVLVGCRRWLEESYSLLRTRSADPLADPASLEMIDLPLPEPVAPGEPGAASGAASFQWLSRAVAEVQSGAAEALVTAPIAKHAWHAAGHTCTPARRSGWRNWRGWPRRRCCSRPAHPKAAGG